ncbi:hypothetical protein [Flavobacterium sp.]|uniref:hypothetical protein n=1 Tax=Flavobacterium sp. TaxID=239 RepID=UPI003BC375A0
MRVPYINCIYISTIIFSAGIVYHISYKGETLMTTSNNVLLANANKALITHRSTNAELQVLIVRSIQREIADDEIRELMNYELV